MENKNDINITEGLYIPSIEACWLYKFNKEVGDYKVDEEYLDKLLKGKIDWSHELLLNNDLVDNIEILENDGKLYTLDIMNVKFNNKYKKKDKNWKVIDKMSCKELRDWTYIKGFKFNGKLMQNFKRGSGKARQGDNLFLLDHIVDKCLDWSRMGLKFNGKQDIGSIRAYESLPLSSIIGYIENINPKNILVIDDYESKFPWTMSKTWLEDGELQTKTDIVQECNSIWDGQGLLSKKIFDDNEFLNGKGVALLRNRYMKCAGFACDIERYYRNYCKKHGLDYNTYEIEDMYGNPIRVKDILLITTPSAIKLKKSNDVVLEEKEEYRKYGEGAWLQYWKDNCDNVFSICKTEKSSHHCIKDEECKIITYRNVLSYQMINTIPFEKEELEILFKPEKEYVEKLKNDLNFFMQEVNMLDLDDEEINNSNKIDTEGAILELVKTNPKFAQTQVFKDYRRNHINAYIDKLRTGKIHIEGADYGVACGNPVEMLLATTGDFTGESVTLQNNELYCSRFEDGEEVVGFRSPHVVVSNCGQQVNRYIEDIHNYMTDTPNIVYFNSCLYPILSIYQGEDFDIDSNLLTNHPTITTACKRINYNITPIPVNRVENTGKNNRELTGKNMSDVDNIIAQNFIGQDINLSMEINSKINDIMNTNPNWKNNNKLVEEIKELFDRASKCSSISCVEIDKAKKQFENLNVPVELDKMKVGFDKVDSKKINEINDKLEKCNNEEEVEKLNNELSKCDTRRIKPRFYKYIGDNKAKKQRRMTKKNHLRDLNKATIKQFAKDKGIKVEDVNEKDKELIKLLKENIKKNNEWVEAQYELMETAMDWLQEMIDGINNKKPVATVQIIHLIKRNTNRINNGLVDCVIEKIKELDQNIKAIRSDEDLDRKEKKEKVNDKIGKSVV